MYEPCFTITIDPIQFESPWLRYNLDDPSICITIIGTIQLDTFTREEPYTIF